MAAASSPDVGSTKSSRTAWPGLQVEARRRRRSAAARPAASRSREASRATPDADRRPRGPKASAAQPPALDAVARRARRRSSCPASGQPGAAAAAWASASGARMPASGRRGRAPAARRPARRRPAPRRRSIAVRAVRPRRGPSVVVRSGRMGSEVLPRYGRVRPPTAGGDRRAAARRRMPGQGIRSAARTYPDPRRMGVTPRSLVVVLTAAGAAGRPAPGRRRRSAVRQLGRASCRASPRPATSRPARTSAASGRVRCVDAMIREMSRRFDAARRSVRPRRDLLASSYLRTTEEFRRAVDGARASSRTRASSPTRAPSSPTSTSTRTTRGTPGERDETPPAWAIAFDAAADRARVGDRRPAARHERPHPARPPVRAGRHRPRQAGRHRRASATTTRSTSSSTGSPTTHDPGDRAPLRPDHRRHQPADDDRRHAPVPDGPGVAGDRLAQRRAARRRADGGARRRVAADIEAYAASQAPLAPAARRPICRRCRTPARATRSAPSTTTVEPRAPQRLRSPALFDRQCRGPGSSSSAERGRAVDVEWGPRPHEQTGITALPALSPNREVV